METLLQALGNPAEMNSQQWLLLVIILLVLAGGVWFVHRLYRIIEADRKSSYVPNIGRKRLNSKGTQAGDNTSPGKGPASGSGVEQDKVE